LPAGTDPFGGGGDEEADEALEPVLDVKTRYFFANLRIFQDCDNVSLENLLSHLPLHHQRKD